MVSVRPAATTNTRPRPPRAPPPRAPDRGESHRRSRSQVVEPRCGDLLQTSALPSTSRRGSGAGPPNAGGLSRRSSLRYSSIPRAEGFLRAAWPRRTRAPRSRRCQGRGWRSPDRARSARRLPREQTQPAFDASAARSRSRPCRSAWTRSVAIRIVLSVVLNSDVIEFLPTQHHWVVPRPLRSRDRPSRRQAIGPPIAMTRIRGQRAFSSSWVWMTHPRKSGSRCPAELRRVKGCAAAVLQIT